MRSCASPWPPSRSGSRPSAASASSRTAAWSTARPPAGSRSRGRSWRSPTTAPASRRSRSAPRSEPRTATRSTGSPRCSRPTAWSGGTRAASRGTPEPRPGSDAGRGHFARAAHVLVVDLLTQLVGVGDAAELEVGVLGAGGVEVERADAEDAVEERLRQVHVLDAVDVRRALVPGEDALADDDPPVGDRVQGGDALHPALDQADHEDHGGDQP